MSITANPNLITISRSFVQLYYTVDFGESFTLLQTNVKSFAWSSGEGIPVHLYVERKEPSSMYTHRRYHCSNVQICDV